MRFHPGYGPTALQSGSAATRVGVDSGRPSVNLWLLYVVIHDYPIIDYLLMAGNQKAPFFLEQSIQDFLPGFALTALRQQRDDESKFKTPGVPHFFHIERNG